MGTYFVTSARLLVTCRGLVYDIYKMDLILIYPPYMIALPCIYIASVLKDKDTTSWFEELHVDMNIVSVFVIIPHRLIQSHYIHSVVLAILRLRTSQWKFWTSTTPTKLIPKGASLKIRLAL
jgi:hypothetical protein